MNVEHYLDTRKMAETLVFLDLEATGIRKPIRITQIAAIACSVNDFQQSENGIANNATRFCKMINPTKALEPIVEDLTGFTNEELEECPKFEDVLPEFSAFFASLPQPVYLVAHGGKIFDFQVLRNELDLSGQKLEVKLIVIDTFPIFKKYAKRNGGRRAGWSYGLRALYKRFYNEEAPSLHDAMGDTLMLAKCCHKISDFFLRWVRSRSEYSLAW